MAYPKNPPFMMLSPNHTPKYSQNQGRPVFGGPKLPFTGRSNSPISPGRGLSSRRQQIRNILINKFRSRFNTFDNQQFQQLIFQEVDSFIQGPAVTAARLKSLEQQLSQRFKSMRSKTSTLHGRPKHQSISHVISQARVEADQGVAAGLPNLTMPAQGKESYGRLQKLEAVNHGTGSRTNLEPGRFLPETVDQEIFSKPHYSALRQSENIIKRSKIASELTGRSRSNQQDEWVQMMMYERKLNEEDEMEKIRKRIEQKQKMKSDLDAQIQEKMEKDKLQRKITEDFAKIAKSELDREIKKEEMKQKSYKRKVMEDRSMRLQQIEDNKKKRKEIQDYQKREQAEELKRLHAEIEIESLREQEKKDLQRGMMKEIMRENIKNRMEKLEKLERERQEDARMQKEYEEYLDRVNEEREQNLKNIKRQAEDRTKNLVENILAEKDRKRREEEMMQKKYFEIKSARERNEETRRVKKKMAEKEKALQVLQKQVEEKRRLRDLEKLKEEEVAVETKTRAEEHAKEVMKEKKTEKSKLMKHKEELEQQIQGNKLKSDIFGGITEDEYRMNRHKISKAQRYVPVPHTPIESVRALTPHADFI